MIIFYNHSQIWSLNKENLKKKKNYIRNKSYVKKEKLLCNQEHKSVFIFLYFRIIFHILN